MYPHRIRLRGPWECAPLARLTQKPDGTSLLSKEDLPPPCRMTLPCRWGEGGLTDFAGRARFVRRFGLPRRLDDFERVWLTFAGIEGASTILLNDHSLGSYPQGAAPSEIEVTALLAERNELQIELEASTSAGGLWGEVALEIRCSAFLRNIQLSVTQTDSAGIVHVQGEVVGTAERPLEVYVLLERSTIAYGTVEPTESGRTFCLDSDLAPLSALNRRDDPVVIRVDLVNGASIWFTVEQFLTRTDGIQSRFE
jgi:hypothetical protein